MIYESHKTFNFNALSLIFRQKKSLFNVYLQTSLDSQKNATSYELDVKEW